MECVRKRGTCVCGCVFVMCARQKAVTLTTGPVFHSHAKKREFARGPWLLTPLSNRCIGWHARKHSRLCTCSHTLAHTNIANSFSLFIYLGPVSGSLHRGELSLFTVCVILFESLYASSSTPGIQDEKSRHMGHRKQLISTSMFACCEAHRCVWSCLHESTQAYCQLEGLLLLTCHRISAAAATTTQFTEDKMERWMRKGYTESVAWKMDFLMDAWFKWQQKWQMLLE